MADDKSKKDYHDRKRINKSEPYEVKYWSKKLHVSPTELKEAIKEVGPTVKNVKKELGK